jgi:hypothetical protein
MLADGTQYAMPEAALTRSKLLTDIFSDGGMHGSAPVRLEQAQVQAWLSFIDTEDTALPRSRTDDQLLQVLHVCSHIILARAPPGLLMWAQRSRRARRCCCARRPLA